MPIRWAFSPDGQKDIRAWLNSFADTTDYDRVSEFLTDNERLAELGRILIQHVDATAETISPGDAIAPSISPDVEAIPLPAIGVTVSPDDWHEQLQDTRETYLGKPGMLVDRSPTGAGKSYADIQMVKRAGDRGMKTLTALPTHANIKERADEMRAAGIDDVECCTPLNDESCGNLQEALKAISVGVHPSTTVCLGCNFRNSCLYHEQSGRLKKTTHVVATHDRLAWSPSAAEERQLIIIDEDATNLLAPKAIFTSSNFDSIAVVLREARHVVRTLSKPKMDLHEFFSVMEENAIKLTEIEQTTSECRAIDLPKKWIEPPWNWQLNFWKSTRDHKLDIHGDALRALVAYTLGRLHQLAIQAGKSDGGQARQRQFIATWRTELPLSATILYSSATTSAADIEHLSGREVTNITPEGHLPNAISAVQIPLDITNGTKPDKVATLLRSIIIDRKAKYVGIHRAPIAHQKADG